MKPCVLMCFVQIDVSGIHQNAPSFQVVECDLIWSDHSSPQVPSKFFIIRPGPNAVTVKGAPGAGLNGHVAHGHPGLEVIPASAVGGAESNLKMASISGYG